MPVCLDHCIRTPRQIHGYVRECFIHRRITISHADNPFAIAQRFVKNLPQHQGSIFNRMMRIYFEIALCLQSVNPVEPQPVKGTP